MKPLAGDYASIAMGAVMLLGGAILRKWIQILFLRILKAFWEISNNIALRTQLVVAVRLPMGS